MPEQVVLIGYSGHAFVAYDIFLSMKKKVTSYCETSEKTYNPFNISFLGNEDDPRVIEQLKKYDYFIAVGNNLSRKRIYENLKGHLHPPVNAIHSSSVLSSSIRLGNGIMISANAVINALCKIGTGVICNTSSTIEHDCVIGNFSHIGPGAVLCGDVRVGENSFIGANSVIKEGIKIGRNVIVGAGTVVVKNVEDNSTIIGNPQKKL